MAHAKLYYEVVHGTRTVVLLTLVSTREGARLSTYLSTVDKPLQHAYCAACCTRLSSPTKT
jgi:hypothetical protein